MIQVVPNYVKYTKSVSMKWDQFSILLKKNIYSDDLKKLKLYFH